MAGISDLEICIMGIVQNFCIHAMKDGDKQTLNREEMKILLTDKLPNLVGGSNSKEAEKFLAKLENMVGPTMDFQEYVGLIASVLQLVYTFMPL